MSEHLTSEQLTEYLGGQENARIQAHLADCARCRDDARRLLHVVGSLRAHAERSAERDAAFWTRQRFQVRSVLIQRRRRSPSWALAAAMAVLLLAAAWMFRTQPSQPPATGQSAQLQNPISDDALLSAVNSTLAQDVPSPLAPVAMLAYEREQAEQTGAHN